MRRSVLILLLAATSACTTFEPLRPDMEARPLPSRADEIAYINELRKAFKVDDPSVVPCYTGHRLKPFRPKYVQGYQEWDEEQETGAYGGQCLRFRDNPGDAAITTYLESGFGLTDLYCQRYFTIATQTRQARRLQRGLFNTGDTLLNAVMAALNGSTNALAISNAGFSAVDSGYGAVDEAFVVAPTRDDVRKLVLSAQQKFRSDVFKQDKPSLPKSYPSARSTVERYAGLCTFDGMRQLVADAVASKTDALNKAAEPETKTGAEDNEAGTAPAAPAVTDGPVAPPPVTPS